LGSNKIDISSPAIWLPYGQGTYPCGLVSIFPHFPIFPFSLFFGSAYWPFSARKRKNSEISLNKN